MRCPRRLHSAFNRRIRNTLRYLLSNLDGTQVRSNGQGRETSHHINFNGKYYLVAKTFRDGEKIKSDV